MPLESNQGVDTMAKRLICAISGRVRAVKIYYDSEIQEYVARLYINGTLYEPGDYFTNDRDDALDTGLAMYRRSVN